MKAQSQFVFGLKHHFEYIMHNDIVVDNHYAVLVICHCGRSLPAGEMRRCSLKIIRKNATLVMTTLYRPYYVVPVIALSTRWWCKSYERSPDLFYCSALRML